MLNFIFLAGVSAMFVSTVSFAVKHEGVRGLGRMVGGAGIALLGITLVSLSFMQPTLSAYFAYGGAALPWGGVALVAFGAFTVYVGLRKFNRRNSGPEAPVATVAPVAASAQAEVPAAIAAGATPATDQSSAGA